MFTGLVEELGQVAECVRVDAGLRLRIRAQTVPEDLTAGDSIAINGVCQTVVGPVESDHFEVIAVPETLARTTFGSLRTGSAVNLERPLKVGDRLGGHWVNGHVDSTGAIAEIGQRRGGFGFRISIPPALSRFVVEKGSIAVDGVSLTVGEVEEGPKSVHFWVYIIPETRTRTLFGSYRVGDQVNLEVDVLGKYVVKAFDLAQGRTTGTDTGPGPSRMMQTLQQWNEEEIDGSPGRN